MDTPGNEYLADGAITFNNASDTKLDIKLQVNDVRLNEYHRNNGFTKIKPKMKTVTGSTDTKLMVSEGMLSLLDIVTRSYMRQVNNDVMVITAVQNMPVVWNGNKLIQQFLNVLGGTLYPLALALLLPVYMYSIV